MNAQELEQAAAQAEALLAALPPDPQDPLDRVTRARLEGWTEGVRTALEATA